jgi:aryl-alcohol dehydrogenase-like predicted oxidoreductase
VGDALVSVQNEFSPVFRSSEPEIAVCEELGLAFLPWSPFGGGRVAKQIGELVPAFGDAARKRGVSPQQICLAWMLAISPCVIPIPGASRPRSVADSVAAADIRLTGDELARLDGGRSR